MPTYEKRLAECAALAAALLLENGGETHRAEETASRICMAGSSTEADVTAFPTCVFIAFSPDGGEYVSVSKRVLLRTIDLGKIDAVNRASRDFTAGNITLEMLYETLCGISKQKTMSALPMALLTALSAAFFALMFDFDSPVRVMLFDATVSFLCGFVSKFFLRSMSTNGMYGFAGGFVGGFTAALAANVVTSVWGIGNVSVIVAGSIIPWLPGLALTSSVRDSVTGDIVSGSSGMTEAILIAAAIACGIGAAFTMCGAIGVAT